MSSLIEIKEDAKKVDQKIYDALQEFYEKHPYVKLEVGTTMSSASGGRQMLTDVKSKITLI